MANTPPKAPSSQPSAPPTVSPPPPAKPASKPATGRMLTPPPSQRKSSGQLAVHGGPAGTNPPPPPRPGAATAGPAGQSVRRPVMMAKPQGLPIKMKVVLSMSGLAIGIVVIIFLIVSKMGNSSLEATIEQSGHANLQQAEAIYRNYHASLTDTGMIAYFSQGNNREKFSAYWNGLHRPWPTANRQSLTYPWFNEQIPACRQFANYSQLVNDRIWVMVASELKSVGDKPPLSNLTDAQRGAILGEQAWKNLKALPPGAKLPEPSTPRLIADEAMQQGISDFFADLVKAYAASGKGWAGLRAAIVKETEEKVSAPLRRAIFVEYRKDFLKDLDTLTSAKDTQVRLLLFTFKSADMLTGFKPEELSLISPSTGAKAEIKASTAARTEVDGQIKTEIDPYASVDGDPAFSFARDQGTGDKVTLYLDRKFINSRQSTLVFSLLGVAAVAILLAVGVAFLVGGNITRPLQVLMSDIQIISGGNFDHRPLAQSRDEVGIVSRLLGDMAAGLKQAQDVWSENQSRKHDLDIAKEIQENLLPKHVPRIAGYDVSAYYSPCKEVGGDYYDFFLVDKTHLGMICADVSGKGIPGSMVMMMTKALVSYEAESNLSPRDIFCKVNRTLAKDIKRGMFVTAFYMLLDIPTARLTVASAGHNPLLMYRASTKQCVEINPGGIALGFDKDGRLFERNMKEETIQLQRGDRVVIYTDGVTEAMSPTGEEFSSERLIQITMQAANAPSSQYLTTLVNALQAHAQSDDQHDDITIVTVKVG